MAMNYRRGMSSVFVTVNPSDTRSPLFIRFACPTLGKTAKVKLLAREQAKLVASDPVAVAMFFDMTIRSFIESLLSYSETHPRRGVLGEVDAYYGTVECMGRGSLHCHMVVWLKGCNWAVLDEILFGAGVLQKRFTEFVDSVLSECKPVIISGIKEEDIPELCPDMTNEATVVL